MQARVAFVTGASSGFLVNNAGLANCIGLGYVTRALLPGMIARRHDAGSVQVIGRAGVR